MPETKRKPTRKRKLTTEKLRASNSLPVKATPRKRTFDLGAALKLRLYNKLTYQQISDQLSVPKSTVVDALKPYLAMIEQPEALEHYRTRKADILEAAEMELVSSLVDPVKLEKASTNNIAYAFGQLNTAIRLERGQSTANVATFEADKALLTELQAEREKLEKQLQTLRNQIAPA